MIPLSYAKIRNIPCFMCVFDRKIMLDVTYFNYFLPKRTFFCNFAFTIIDIKKKT